MILTDPNKRLILYNTLGSAIEITDSVIGPDGVATGGTYVAGKFGNGFLSDANSEYVTITNILDNLTVKGAIDIWIVPKSTFDDGSTDRYILTSVGADLYLYYDASEDDWTFTIGGQSATLNDTSVPDDTPIHIRCIWNNGVTNKVRIIVDGVEGTPSTTTFTTPDDTDLRVGNNNADSAFASAVLDNLKVWNYDNDSVAGREIEYPIIAGTEFGGTRQYLNPNKKLLSWNTLESALTVGKSKLGPNGSVTGSPTYLSVNSMFGNGIKCTTNNYASMVLNGILNRDSFVISIIVKYDTYSMTNGDPSDGNNHDIFQIGTNGLSNNPIGGLFNLGSANYSLAYINPTSGSDSFTVQMSSGIDVSINDIVFWAFIYDKNQSSPNRLRIKYHNISSGQNGLFSETSSSGSGQTPAFDPGDVIKIGQSVWQARGADAIIDNFKIHNFVKTAFPEKDVEHPLELNGTNFFNTTEKQIYFLNTFDNANSVTKSVLGPDGVATGGSFTAGKFGNGFQVDANSEYITINELITGLSAFAFEIWVKPINTFDDGSTDRYIFSSESSEVLCFYDASANNWVLEVNGNQATFNDTSVPDDTLVHIAGTFDGSSNIKIWIDDVEGTPYSGATTALTDDNIRFGNNQADSLHASSVLDNPKFYNFYKQNFIKEIEFPINLKEVITI
ncbi:MAG: hypothetical protein GWN64_07700 [Candidatus Thorarchaeota archaeon]|nr:hypothetical protein [Candidatus Thorarchaeota archaeon]